MDKQARIKQINQQIMLTNIIDTPFTLLLGLVLYVRFENPEITFLPLLNNPIILNILLGTCLVVMIFSGVRIFKLTREKNALLTTEE